MGTGTAIYAFFFLIVGTFALGCLSAAPWVPTKRSQRARLHVALEPRRGAVVYDLGCGDGSVLFDIAARRPDVRAVGFEISILPLIIGWIRKAVGRHRNVSLRLRDLFGQHFGDADVVFVFLLKDCYPKLVAKLRKELKDDATVVVEAWPFPGIEPARVVPGDRDILPFYFYSGSGLRKTDVPA